MIFDWIYRVIYRRQLREDMRELAEMQAQTDRRMNALDARIREAFTPAEWAEVRARCERRLM